MSTVLRTAINQLFYAGLSKKEFDGITPDLHKRNYRYLSSSCVLALTLLTFLIFASFVVGSIGKNRTLYIATALCFAVIYLLTKSFARKNERLTLPLFYVFLSVAYAFGGILGVPLMPTMTSTTFCVLLFALPLLIADRPYRVDILLIAATVAFCFATHAMKPPEISSVDIVNALSFLFLGIAINAFMMNVKFKDLLHHVHVEHERDTDDLTKLMTKAATVNAIKNYLEESKDTEGRTAALLVLDIDNFKAVNDTMGHAFGDAVLRIMGECIHETFRSTDILGRFGGDEFVVFLPDTSQREIVERRVSVLVDAMEEQLTSSQVLPITGSIGIAFLPADATTYNELFQCADKALYESKGKGKNCYTFYLDKNLPLD